MAKGEFPHILKIAPITPIPETTTPKSPSDYRPTNVLSSKFQLSPTFLKN